jgi:HlyD family secretion protein
MKKSIFNASLIAIIAVGAIVSIFLYKSLSKRPEYKTIQAQKGDIEETLNLNGSIKPQNEAGLGFERGGRITQLTHKVGDFVKAGTVLAYANADDLAAQYRQAQDLAKSAQSNLDQYQALLKKSKDQLDSLRRTDAISADKNAQKAQIDANEAQVESQQANVSAALENVKNAKSQISKTMITAPFDGTISEQNAEVGEVPQAGAVVINFINQDSFKVEVYVSDIDVKNLSVGDMAQVTVDNLPGQVYAAKITSIDPAESIINNVPSYKITLNFSDAVPGLRSGAAANILITTQKKNDVVIVPKDAVFESNGKKFVYISAGGLQKQKEVQTGIYGNDNKVEIISGLAAGDAIFELSQASN